MVEDVKPDLIFVTEMWLHPDINNAEDALRLRRIDPKGTNRTPRETLHNVCKAGIDATRREHRRQRRHRVCMADDTGWKRIEDNDWLMLRPIDWQRIRCKTTPHLSWSVQGQRAVCNNRRLQSPDNWLGYTQGRTRRPRIPGSCPGLLSNPTRTRTDARGKHTRPDPQHRGTHDRRHHDPTTPLEQRQQRHQLQSYSGRKRL